MKLARLFTLGAAAVLSTAIASATTYQFGSYATGDPNLANKNTALVFERQPSPTLMMSTRQWPRSGLVCMPHYPTHLLAYRLA
jgi:hypothetical protein